MNNFEVQFLLPGGSNLNLSVRSDCSLSQLKETVCFEAQKNKKMLLMNYSLYLFKTFDKILLENESITIGNVPYISQCRKHCTTPKLILVQKRIDPFTSQVRSPPPSFPSPPISIPLPFLLTMMIGDDDDGK